MELTDPQVLATVATYVAGWNEPDAGRRAELFAECWAEDGVYTDPRTVMTGRDELTAGCRSFAERVPGGRIDPVGGVSSHHGHASFAWCVRDAAGEKVAEGFDYAEFAADGRIRRIVGFFGTLPWPGSPA